MPRASSEALVFVLPVLALERPVLLVVADQALLPQLAVQLGGEAAGGEIADLDVELALLADHGVDLAELGLVEHAARVDVELLDRDLREVIGLRLELLLEIEGGAIEAARVGDVAIEHRREAGRARGDHALGRAVRR